MDLDKLKDKAYQAKNKNRRLLQKIKKKKGVELDQLFNQAHDNAFSCIDCLKCANCCTTTGPLFIDKDIDRIAKHLRLKPQQFISQYLKMDDEGDYILQSVPCTFLGADNMCSIYDVRPKACADYPHTDRNKQHQILNLNLKNTEVCPAVYEVFEEIKKKV
jgi:Fe-S-cluster containining protein